MPRNMDRGGRRRTKNEGAIKVMDKSMWSAMMFPKSRMDRERTRAKWLTSSMGNMRGASQIKGPMKCLRYFMPWA